MIAKEKENLVTTHTSTIPSKLSQGVNCTSISIDISGLNKYIQESEIAITEKLYKSAWLQLLTTEKSVNNLVLLCLATILTTHKQILLL